MLVKIVKNGDESEWFELTKQRHRALLEDAPEAVITLINNLYTNSPDSGTYVKLDFSLFTVLARDFVLEENRQEKMLKRYHDKRPLEDLDARHSEQGHVPGRRIPPAGTADHVEPRKAETDSCPVEAG